MKTEFPVFSGLQVALKQGERDPLHLLRIRSSSSRWLRSKRVLPLGRAQRTSWRCCSERNKTGPVTYSETFSRVDGGAVLRTACLFRLEGIVSKRLEAPYRSGALGELHQDQMLQRPGNWWLAAISPSTRVGRGRSERWWSAITMMGRLIYAGPGRHRIHADRWRGDLWKRLHPLETSAPPFDPNSPASRPGASDVRWVEPRDRDRSAIARLDRGWARCVRRRFKGVREDKSPHEVVREKTGARPGRRRAQRPAPKSAAETAKTMTRTSKTKPRARKPPSFLSPAGPQRRPFQPPTPTESIGPTSGSPSKIWRITIARSGTGWRRTSSVGHSALVRWSRGYERPSAFFSKSMLRPVSPMKNLRNRHRFPIGGR